MPKKKVQIAKQVEPPKKVENKKDQGIENESQNENEGSTTQESRKETNKTKKMKVNKKDLNSEKESEEKNNNGIPTIAEPNNKREIKNIKGAKKEATKTIEQLAASLVKHEKASFLVKFSLPHPVICKC